MGAHHARTTTIAPMTRVAGRGVLTATAALALTGAGAGAALAHDGAHGSDHEWDEVSSESSGTSELCDVFGEVDGDTTDAGLDLPGLTDSSGDLCSPDFAEDTSDRSGSGYDSSGHGDTGSSDTGDDATSAPTTSTPPPSSSTPAPAPATAKPAAAPALSPEDMPPAPGQTKTLQIPARTTS